MLQYPFQGAVDTKQALWTGHNIKHVSYISYRCAIFSQSTVLVQTHIVW